MAWKIRDLPAIAADPVGPEMDVDTMAGFKPFTTLIATKRSLLASQTFNPPQDHASAKVQIVQVKNLQSIIFIVTWLLYLLDVSL